MLKARYEGSRLNACLCADAKRTRVGGDRIKLCHVITGLNCGGAETMLYKLLSRLDPEAFDIEVISLIDIGPIGQKIQALGIPVRALGMRRGMPDPLALLRLICWFRCDRPDVIQSWMYHADLLAGLAAWAAGGLRVVWGIRNGTLDAGASKQTSIWTARACARLSRCLPTKIICCAEASREVHKRLGYADEKIRVIPNGFDPNVFKPDASARRSVRRELRISDAVPLIGLVARFDPQKDHQTFVEAAAILKRDLPGACFVLCGQDITWENLELSGWIEASGARDSFRLLGSRDDVARLTAGLDVASTSSSFGEAFPNVIAEAMSSGVPCVVTDVGDSATIVGDTGVVVPPRNPEALADGWKTLLMDTNREERFQLGLAARQRIIEKYSLDKIVSQYACLYESLAK